MTGPKNIQLMRPIFHLYGHIKLKFNSKSVCDAFLKTVDLKSVPIYNGNYLSLFASKKGNIFGPISHLKLFINSFIYVTYTFSIFEKEKNIWIQGLRSTGQKNLQKVNICRHVTHVIIISMKVNSNFYV